MRYSIGLIHKDADSDFGVSFPDFPGCVSAGETLDEAVAMGREALEGHVAVMAEGGEAIPEPTGMAEMRADPENRDDTPVLIPLAPTMAKTVRVNITMPADTLSGIDAFAEQQGYTRSGFWWQPRERPWSGLREVAVKLGGMARGDPARHPPFPAWKEMDWGSNDGR